VGGQTFLTGDAISLADIMMVTHIEYLSMTPEGGEILAGRPLLSWLERMQARPSLRATGQPVGREAA
jgi:glutathione S-transferase